MNADVQLRALLAELEAGLFERGLALRLCFLAALAGESVFLLGPPGTAKSLLARRLQAGFRDAVGFDYLMGRFSTPEELFGPVSIAKLRDEDRYERQTAGYLPQADIVFLDEIWKAGPPIQNALLTALNEKVWRNGDREIQLPLKCLIGASNELASEEVSRAFWDRFLVRVPLGPIQDDAVFGQLLATSGDRREPITKALAMSDWQTWQDQIRQTPPAEATIRFFVALRRRLRQDLPGLIISDRRWKKTVTIVQAAAFLHGREVAAPLDHAVAAYCLWDEPGQLPRVREMVAEVIGVLWFPAQSVPTKSAPAADGQLLILDDEYLLIVDSAQTLGKEAEARLWLPDLEVLDAAPRPIDLFFYTKGAFARSQEVLAQKGAGDTIVIDGVSYDLARSIELPTSPQTKEDSPDLTEDLARRQSLRTEWETHQFRDAIDLDRASAAWDQSLAKLSRHRTAARGG